MSLKSAFPTNMDNGIKSKNCKRQNAVSLYRLKGRCSEKQDILV